MRLALLKIDTSQILEMNVHFMNVNEIISIDPEICFGKPHIKGTRIKVSFILELVSSGWTIEQILQEYEHLSREQVIACLIYAGYVVDKREGKWKFLMRYDFFCDENITKRLQATIKKFGYPVDSVRSKKLYGLNNGDLVKYLNGRNYMLITFDKDFLKADFSVNQGIIVLEIIPNRDEFTVPLLEKFLILLKNEKINCVGKKILLNQEFFSSFK